MTPTKTDLLPCPFCGSRDAKYMTPEETLKGLDGGIYCQACGGSSGVYFKNEASAITAWNTRTQPTADIEGDYNEALHKIVMKSCAATMSMEECRNMEIEIIRLHQASQKGAVSHAPYCPQSEQCLCQTQITQANRVSGADAVLQEMRLADATYDQRLREIKITEWFDKNYQTIRARLADQKEG